MRISDWSSDVCSSDLVLLEAVGEILDYLAVEILAAEEGVAVGRLHLEHAVADFEDRNVEGAAAQVIDGDRLVLGLVEAIGERGRGRLVDDAQHFQPRDLAGVLGRLALGVVEVGGHEIGRAYVELQSLMRIAYAVFCLKKTTTGSYEH